MKANLPEREPAFQKLWEELNVYKTLSEREAPNGEFLLHDGPPYSNGDIHMGHALNKVLKDFVVRFKAMSGYRTPFVPGWDNHGLPIENKVSESFRKKHEAPSRLEMRRACREYAAKWVDIQREQFKRLGVIGDWDNPYLTMDYAYEAAIIQVFGELAEQGYIYRGLKPIHWCINDETALAEAEIEYAEHTSPSIYVRFPVRSDPRGIFGGDDRPGFAVIWTTTPWTIPANLAIAAHPDHDYAVVEADGARYLIAAELTGKTMQAIGIDTYCVARTVRGSDLDGLVFGHPIYDRDSRLVHADYVTLDEGTGLVHTAPGHGREDFETGQKYGLDILCPVDDRGFFTAEAGRFAGMHILKEGNQAVVDALRQNGALLAESRVSHSYPHCWRCQKPVVFRTTVQWFMALDHSNLRQKMLEIIDRIACYPAEGRNRLRAMIESSPDWCLSRQRSWGVAIPVFFCRQCGEPVMTPETIGRVRDVVAAEGSDAWFEKDTAELLPEGWSCAACGGRDFDRETDVLDVWFDSGSSCRAVTERRHGRFAAEMYLEGSDQHRGWFNKSLVIGVGTRGDAPFSELVTHGFVLDAEGKKMSKTRGNVIAPKEVLKTYGADVLRLYVSSLNYFEDVRFGQEMFTRATDAYRRIRNTFRFMLGNLSDFDPAADALEYSELVEIDRFALTRLSELVDRVRQAYECYEFHKVYHLVHNYCAVDLSSFYLDILKDRLYASGRGWKIRRSAQTALYHITSALVRMLAPILVHTAEEVWQLMPGTGKEKSVHLTTFPQVPAEWNDQQLAEKWRRINEVRDLVLLALEEARQNGRIGKPLESRVRLHAPEPLYEFLAPYADVLPSVFIVSQVELLNSANGEPTVEVVPPPGSRCERCWLVLESVGSHPEHPTLCDRCFDAVSGTHP